MRIDIWNSHKNFAKIEKGNSDLLNFTQTINL